MKIILSRKGFDSTAGGGYSPWNPKTGKYIVLPIPDGEINSEKEYLGNGTKYEKIQLDPEYLRSIDNDIEAQNLYELIESLSQKCIIPRNTPEKIGNKYAHFDPWLGHCDWLTEKSNHSIGAFGQVRLPQSHLFVNNVGKGDLFLFFSRFKPLNYNKKEEERFRISPEHAKGGLYFIYGWLKVKELVTEYGNKCELENHPHYAEQYFNMYPKEKTTANTIYLADNCGYFPELDEKLLLTANDNQQKIAKDNQHKKFGNWIPSRLGLRSFFYQKLTHTNDIQWTNGDDNNMCMFAPQGPGQEYIFPRDGVQQEATDQKLAKEWVTSLSSKIPA